jgi:hypothetical protein
MNFFRECGGGFFRASRFHRVAGFREPADHLGLGSDGLVDIVRIERFWVSDRAGLRQASRTSNRTAGKEPY